MDETFSLQNQIQNAPQEIKRFLAQGRWSSVVQEIAKKNNFSVDQAVSLENETLFILTGLELKRDFKENIKRELSIPDILARDIADETEEMVFKEVNDFLPTSIEGEEETPQLTTNTIPQKPTINSTPPQSAVIPNDGTPTPSNLPGAKPSLDILQRQSELPTTTLEQTLSQKVPTGENQIVEKKSYPGQDPYREPV